MKEIGTIHWKSENNCTTNTSLFSALPGEIRGGHLDLPNIGYSIF
jgi:hypothetical protein